MMTHPTRYTDTFGPESPQVDQIIGNLIQRVLSVGEGCGADYNASYIDKIDGTGVMRKYAGVYGHD
jgi:hypothetical protein